MAEYCANRIFFKTTPSEKREIVSAFEQGKIDWPMTCAGLVFCEEEMSCSTKYRPIPWDEGYMASFSAMYPTILFQYKTDARMYGTWFGNGKEDGKSVLNEEIKILCEETVQRFCNATTQAAEGLRHRVEITVDGCVAEDGENIFGECDVYDWTDIVQVSCGNWHTVGLKKDGTLLACGSNANGQCNVDGISGVVFVSCGRYHTAILHEDGRVTVLGHLEPKEQDAPQPAVQDWTGINRILSVYDAVIGFQEDGTLLVMGNPGCTERALKVYLGLAKAPKKKEMSSKTGGTVLTVAEAKKLWDYRVNKDKTITLYEYYGTESHVRIPEMIGKTPVTELFCAFCEDENICSVVIPKTVRKVSNSFQDCPELKLESVLFEGEMPELFLSFTGYCDPVDENGFVKLRNALIGFSGESDSVTIPEGITHIGNEAFYNHEELKNVFLPKGVKYIENDAFAYCTALKEIAIPEGLVHIGFNAFYKCSSLQKVVLPEGVQRIDDKAFYDCESLKEINLPASVIEIGTEILNKKNKKTVVYVKEGSYAEQYCKEKKLTYSYV